MRSKPAELSGKGLALTMAKNIKRSSHHGDLTITMRVQSLRRVQNQASVCNQVSYESHNRLTSRVRTMKAMVRGSAVSRRWMAGTNSVVG